MRIDAHQHFWIYTPDEYGWINDSMQVIRRNFLPEDLAAELEQNRFDGSVTVQARQTLEETRWLLSLADRNPRILGVVGWVDLRAPDVREQLWEFSKNRKFVGVRHIVQSEPDERFLMREDFLRGIEVLEEFDLAYDILIYTQHLAVAAEFVERFPRQRFVLDHMAKPPIKAGDIDHWSAGILRLADFPNVLCKMSGLVTEADWQHWTDDQIVPYLDVAYKAFGAERLMIGSDWPVCLVAASYRNAMNIVEKWLGQFPSETRDAILGGNAQLFWKLRP